MSVIGMRRCSSGGMARHHCSKTRQASLRPESPFSDGVFGKQFLDFALEVGGLNGSDQFGVNAAVPPDQDGSGQAVDPVKALQLLAAHGYGVVHAKLPVETQNVSRAVMGDNAQGAETLVPVTIREL